MRSLLVTHTEEASFEASEVCDFRLVQRYWFGENWLWTCVIFDSSKGSNVQILEAYSLWKCVVQGSYGFPFLSYIDIYLPLSETLVSKIEQRHLRQLSPVGLIMGIRQDSILFCVIPKSLESHKNKICLNN